MTLRAMDLESLVLMLVDLAVAEGQILLTGVARVVYVDECLGLLSCFQNQMEWNFGWFLWGLDASRP